MSIDLIQRELEQPIDWEKFEQIVYDILVQDDLPRLRKLGGQGDFGMDAVDEAFYENETQTECIVQITSQKTQISKFIGTVKRIRESNREPRLLVMVYRQPVASPIRREIQEKALELGIAVDIRDQGYLVGQLAKPTGIFARHFGTLAEQVERLLSREDPLQAVPDRAYRAMLASLGAFVANPKARLARDTLFIKAVLAAIVSRREAKVDELITDLAVLFPEEHRIERARLNKALSTLEHEGDCTCHGDQVKASKSALEKVGTVIARAELAYESLLNHVLERVEGEEELDDATKGYLERNLRRAIVELLRVHGPLSATNNSGTLGKAIDDSNVMACFAQGVSESLARRAAIATHEYATKPENADSLAALTRSYVALAIRNVDPLGRRWQQQALSRSEMALDTDVVLVALVDDLPESASLRAALNALVNQGVRLIIPEAVFTETIDHLSRAYKTHGRFSSRLHRMSPDAVDATVWHAVVRGYYYANRGTTHYPWEEYWAKYYNSKKPREYLSYLLQRRFKHEVDALRELDEKEHADVEQIVQDVMSQKERLRRKSQFRDEEQMETRVYRDVRIAMSMAREHPQGHWRTGAGYVVSEDTAFRRFERHPAWEARPPVHIFTRALPQLVGMICGQGLDNSIIIRLLFDPVATAAAGLMAGEIDLLARAGVDLSTRSVERLEWDLREALQETIHDDPQASDGDPDDAEILKIIRVAKLAESKGYSLEPAIAQVVAHYEEVLSALDKEKALRSAAEAKRDAAEAINKEKIKKITKAAIGQTKKGKSRVRRALSQFGLSLDDLIAEYKESKDNTNEGK